MFGASSMYQQFLSFTACISVSMASFHISFSGPFIVSLMAGLPCSCILPNFFFVNCTGFHLSRRETSCFRARSYSQFCFVDRAYLFL